MGAVIAALPTAVAFGKPKPKPKPPTFKVGTYNAKLGPEATKFNVVLKRATCAAAPGQAKSSLHLCVALPVSPRAACTVPLNVESPIGSFVAPVQLPTSGKLTQQAPIKPVETFIGAPPATGQSTFAVTFTKKGTASGYVELNLMITTTGTNSFPCATGKIPFTAKLG